MLFGNMFCRILIGKSLSRNSYFICKKPNICLLIFSFIKAFKNILATFLQSLNSAMQSIVCFFPFSESDVSCKDHTTSKTGIAFIFFKSHKGLNLSKYQGQGVSIIHGKRKLNSNWPFANEYISRALSLTNTAANRVIFRSNRINTTIIHPFLEISHNPYSLLWISAIGEICSVSWWVTWRNNSNFLYTRRPRFQRCVGSLTANNDSYLKFWKDPFSNSNSTSTYMCS